MKFIVELPDYLAKSTIETAISSLVDVSESRVESMHECYANGDLEGAEAINKVVEQLEAMIDALGSAKPSEG